MVTTGLGLIEDGVFFAEGGELIYEAKWGDGCINKKMFAATLYRVCGWDDDLVNESIKLIC